MLDGFPTPLRYPFLSFEYYWWLYVVSFPLKTFLPHGVSFHAMYVVSAELPRQQYHQAATANRNSPPGAILHRAARGTTVHGIGYAAVDVVRCPNFDIDWAS